MLYLDDIISLQVPNLVINKSKTYPYTIWEKTYTGTNAIFVGNTFLQAGQTSTTIDIADILANQRWLPVCLLKRERINHSHRPVLVGRYFVSIDDGTQDKLSEDVEVVLAYRYPNRKNYMESALLRHYSTHSNDLPFLQGYRPATNTLMLTPHIPFIATTEYPLLFANQHGQQLLRTNYNLRAGKGLVSNPYSIAMPAGDDVFSIPLYNLFRNTKRGIEEYKTNIVYDINGPAWDHTTADTYISDDRLNPSELGIYDQDWNLIVSHSIEPEESFDFAYNIILTGVTRLYFVLDERLDTNYAVELTVDTDNIPKDYVQFSARVSCGEYQPAAGGYQVTIDQISFLCPDNETTVSDISLYSGTREIYKVADVDICPSRYYLAWQDRYGGFQSQPFSKGNTFSEEFERSEVRDYHLEHRPASIKVIPKWQINTDWIQESLYPLYESIYVSPYLLLYDAQEDKSYNVKLTDTNYTEKTFKNQRKMFNLTLNLKESREQNIIY